MEYIAHCENGRVQTVESHLSGTAELAEEYARRFGAGEAGRFCGLVHDIGKYSQAFQRRVRGSDESVDHSTAGAIEAAKRKCLPAAFCVAGHHGGLPDGGDKSSAVPQSATLKGRLSRRVSRDIEDYSAFQSEITPPGCETPKEFKSDPESFMFFTRMLFSCLVDADWLDTEKFVKEGSVERGGFAELTEYAEKLLKKISPWLDAPRGALGGARNEILQSAIDAACREPGLFSLTAPTGSGKTTTSMAFALPHALRFAKRRIIYVIPYCSIIEQTQRVFEEIFGPASVVAHYANVDYKTNEGAADKRYLASENWDAPVILTSTVQFFESVYANKPSRCRKLHNLANSVIIFDEAQMLPAPFLRPCVGAIAQLVRLYGCTAVLCTATQPSLAPLFADALAGYPIREICPRPAEMYRLFRRVRYEKLGTLAEDALTARLKAHGQVLCVVNRRDQAQTLYETLPKEGRFHLSTAMYPAHRRACLDEIRARLSNGLVCRVVSTSMVEAGVDLDFPAVYRALAGLDSIVQAGGRCNREGKNSPLDSVVYIFESERQAPRMLGQNVSSARMVLDRFDDPASPEAIAEYFDDLFYVAKGLEALDEKKIIPLTSRGDFPFREIAEIFQIIENSQHTVYIPCEESRELLRRLEKSGPDRALMRELGAYAVGVYPDHYAELLKIGAVREIADGAAVLEDARLYSAEKGLALTVEEGRSMIS